ncbi:hypothetical protein WEN_01920 [Mycoplasma wenyonii str. Massachusetts]|uniref:Uncharacterized protein n=1 Tax=Mycoplasma wenyonii (strain Massachusetts) TaxID=1197325 RepID=I6ZEZ1_MYCWM|nr:hypothetical protein [Mycoplasma wenyonii]AFN65177.1 hypothetical protein WEN_01920 [Mycoplasma wenyonii str. Massachusetts]
MVLLKVFAIPVVGLGSVGVMSPLIYIGSTSSTFKTSWKSYLSSSSPVLQDCKSSDGKYYTVLLELNPKKGETNADSSEISFRVEETSGKWEKNKGKVVWRGREAENSLKDWGLQPRTKTQILFMYPDPSGYKYGDQVRKFQATCENGGVIESTQGFNNTIELSSLKLTMTDEQSCQSSFGYVECSVNITPSDKLKWKEGTEPKVIYTAF